MRTIDGILYARMIRSGAAKLKENAEKINDLNVFPIPDGDTGDNMLLTMMGGVPAEEDSEGTLSRVAEQVSDGMLLSARGNSGVILSQFFEGLKIGFASLKTADAEQMADAFRRGVKQAYSAVMKPQEGTILTVMRITSTEAEGSAAHYGDDVVAFFTFLEDVAKRALAREMTLATSYEESNAALLSDITSRAFTMAQEMDSDYELAGNCVIFSSAIACFNSGKHL
jgi:dihydroxyacetone kinase-like predicted kinase